MIYIRQKVFLGGTCAGSDWRKVLIPMLEIDHFNPVVDEWNEEAREEEFRQKEIGCDFILYTITGDSESYYSIAEVVDDSNKRPHRTIMCLLTETMSPKQKSSMEAVAEMVERNGTRVFYSLEDVADYLNSQGNQM